MILEKLLKHALETKVEFVSIHFHNKRSKIKEISTRKLATDIQTIYVS